MALLLAIVTFLIAACVVFVVWMVAGSGARKDVVGERLEAVREVERRGTLSPDVKILRDELLSTVPAVNRILLKWAWPTGLKKFVAQAGLTIKPGRIILLSAILAVAAYEFFDYVFQEPILSLIAGALIALLPLGIVAWKRGKRLAKFEEQLPEALDLLGRAVRAGHSFTTGLELIGKECSEPVAGEFRTTFEEQNFGLPLRDSLINLTERVPLVDVRLLVTALLIQKDTGGNLAEILDELSRVIRERFKIYRDVRVKSAQGRLTAGILIAMPLIMMALLGGVNPNYLHILFNDPAGHTMLIVAGLMQIVGSFLLWRIVNIEV
jgi:tight adherence protein B